METMTAMSKWTIPRVACLVGGIASVWVMFGEPTCDETWRTVVVVGGGLVLATSLTLLIRSATEPEWRHRIPVTVFSAMLAVPMAALTAYFATASWDSACP